jgi:hypothetical protein
MTSLKFRSKIDLGLAGFIFIPAAICIVFAYLNKIWILVSFFIFLLGFLAYLYLSTYYLLSGGYLIVKAGFLYKKQIRVNDIRKVVLTRNPMAAPALSLKRIEILTGNCSLIVSPGKPELFLKGLLEFNPHILVVKDAVW